MNNDYNRSPQEVLEELGSCPTGLTEQQAAERLAKYGPNKLQEAEKPTLLQRFLTQLKDPMLLILLAAAAVSAVTNALSGESFTEVFIILIVVLLNAVLGVVQESKAEAAIEALQTMTAAKCKVLRGGHQTVIENSQLVPGDVVLLEAGDAVPADGRLLESASMKIEEAALTGESMPVSKIISVLGAGDGGVVRELTRYPEIEHIDMVEIDPQVVEVCKEYLPGTACCLDDPRLTIHYEDGLKYVRTRHNCYDLIIVDSTDPFGPGEGLFTREFYGNCYKALRDDGIMVNQHESPFYDEDAAAMQRSHKRIVESFPISKVYQAHIPTYPSGHWLFGFASKKYHPVNDFNGTKWSMLGLKTRYYNPRLHVGAFALPNYVEELLRDVE